MKRFIDIHVPITSCNFQCEYCYVTHQGLRNTKKVDFQYDVETVKKALSQERLGGLCHFNICGEGETLLPKEIVDYTKAILENGHYVMIVTNGTLSNRFEEFANFPLNLRKRLGFKFSFHYKELKEKKMLDTFNNNIKIVKNKNMSYSIEMTPCDSLEPYIEEIKEYCIKEYGAPCHLTIPRNMLTNEIELLSEHNIDEFYNIWKVFDSKLFDFKYSTWGEKRQEYCYAGMWSGLLNIGTGNFSACYTGRLDQNIFENPDKPIKFCAIGKKCKLPHCFNGHSFLSLGTIPEINTYRYNQLRDRTTADGKHWLNKEMNNFLNERLSDDNTELTNMQKIKNEIYKTTFYFDKAKKHIGKKIKNETK